MRAAFLFAIVGASVGFAAGAAFGPSVLPAGKGGSPAAAAPRAGAEGSSAETTRLREELSRTRKERDEARARAEKAEGQAKLLTAVSGQLETKDGRQARLSPEETRKRAAELRQRFDEAFAKGDGAAVVEALAELNRLGEEAFPTIAEISAK